MEHFLGSCWGHSQGQCSADLSMAPQGRILRKSKNIIGCPASRLKVCNRGRQPFGHEVPSLILFWLITVPSHTHNKKNITVISVDNMPLKLTRRPVDIGVTRHFLIGAFALCPALWRHQGAGGGFRA